MSTGLVDAPVGAGVRVVAVSRSPAHGFSKPREDAIRLLAGLGVEGDAHAGVTVQHRSRVAVDPTQPNLRQVHLIHAELHAALAEAGFDVGYGELGENITTQGIDLLRLPTGTRLHIGTAEIEITGLRNPCVQIDQFRKGLLRQLVYRDALEALVRKAGVMGVVLAGGMVRPGDVIETVLPALPHRALERV
ncbi:MOSC domain-containing protein YiiM [Cupriavidus sp. YR651]|uniref:MOSC domain-containing protein n=1 Tax=Cupriavidus sp. YR651 TaxID=1855315 RepID=UPI000883D85C|nr:MOSC domain-containing protein [Cupriavidus sp. YR651]SDD29763.1 MOSC domain-containing protein YiiM [Cupriavidus sp. YR651]